MRLPAALLLLSPLLTSPVLADSPESWDLFRQQVHEACLATLETLDLAGQTTLEVNPFGSERYGVALVRVAQASGVDVMACVYDKATGSAEVTTPFTQAE